MQNWLSLVEKSKEGDLESFRTLVGMFQGMAHGYALSVLGDYHLAQDATQEAFLEAYRTLPQLEHPAAFPAWLRSKTFKHCDRIHRKKRLVTVPLEKAADVQSHEPLPSDSTEELQMEEKVLKAIMALSESQRAVTTLFYIDGYSQEEIADFLDISPGAVKKRLHDSRRKLRERMVDMVEETLRNNAPDKEFSNRVVEELLSRPRLLEIPDHPVTRIAKLIREALSEYEFVSGEEIIERETYPYAPDAIKADSSKILRTSTTQTTLQAAKGRKPPVRFVTCGRTFRPIEEDAMHLKVFHQADVLCIEPGATVEKMKETFSKIAQAILGEVELNWIYADKAFPPFEDCYEVQIFRGEEMFDVGGTGQLPEGILNDLGFDGKQVSGFGFGVGLERLAMLKFGLKDIGSLWQAPYVT